MPFVLSIEPMGLIRDAALHFIGCRFVFPVGFRVAILLVVISSALMD
jgi:hypothetical protein